jgi:hypothetical protein
MPFSDTPIGRQNRREGQRDFIDQRIELPQPRAVACLRTQHQGKKRRFEQREAAVRSATRDGSSFTAKSMGLDGMARAPRREF